MKLVYVILALFSGAALAEVLISDPLDVRTDYVGIQIDGAEVSDCGSVATPCLGVDVSGQTIISYDVTSVIAATPTFSVRARACVDGGTCSPWTVSVPFDFAAPALPTGLKIVGG